MIMFMYKPENYIYFLSVSSIGDRCPYLFSKKYCYLKKIILIFCSRQILTKKNKITNTNNVSLINVSKTLQ